MLAVWTIVPRNHVGILVPVLKGAELSIVRIRGNILLVLLLVPILYNTFVIPFRIAFYYGGITRDPLVFSFLDIVFDMCLWADIVARVRYVLIRNRRQKFERCFSNKVCLDGCCDYLNLCRQWWGFSQGSQRWKRCWMKTKFL